MFRSFRSFLHFVSLCLAETFRHGRSTIDLFATIAGIAIPLVQKFWPSWFARHGVVDVNDLFWQVPLGAAATVFWARLVLSPFWVYQKQGAKLALYETDGPIFRFTGGRMARKAEFFWRDGPENPPAAVVTFDIQFRNIGGGIASEGFFIIHYCWLREPSVVRTIISPVTVGDTIPGEDFWWTFPVEQKPATKLNNPEYPWWFDQAGLLLVVELCYTANFAAGPPGGSGRTFWLSWYPSANQLTFADKYTAEAVRPFINQHVMENEQRWIAAAPPDAIQTSIPDAEGAWGKLFRRCTHLFDY